MKRIYLLTTEHLKKGLWFREDEDFRVAMNFVAIQAAGNPEVVVLAFINGFKQRYSIYFRRKYGVKEFLRRNDLDIRMIPYDDEGPEKAVAYVQMNYVAANICSYPQTNELLSGQFLQGEETADGR